ncbi:6056_t:CDS:2 [Paraglomus occultum]|uniref:acetylornithine transaminase n=1 Tax=Paraglomus occultum TaxID=144539 RepID=A0A9N8W1U3_9GLOM|nr:6056_t:CDS:2 [Paraglomus occultum]
MLRTVTLRAGWNLKNYGGCIGCGLLNSEKAMVASARNEKYCINTYARPPIIITSGKGSYVYDTSNRRYLDFTAGIAVSALGHADQELAHVLYDQALKLIHSSNLFHNQQSGELAELLVNSTRESGGFDAAKVFFSNSGTEANEGAMKFARKWGKHVAKPGQDKYGFVSFLNSFHGRSMGALSVTPQPKYQAPFAPMVPGCTYAPFNDVEKVREFINEGTCGVIVEPVQGEGGIYEASFEFLSALRSRCDEVGALLIYDEIQCGLGRTGKLWAHGYYPKNCHPDIVTMAKPLANGIPIGAIMATSRVADVIGIGDHGTTFGGNPLACRAALSVVSRLKSPALLSNVTDVGNYIKSRLESFVQKYPKVAAEVRGKGLILGLQLNVDPVPLLQLARDRGLLVITAGKNVVRLVPPLNLKKEEAKEGMDILEAALDEFVQTNA